jgi:transposase-like protein
LCLTHFRRNLKNELSRELYAKVKEKLERLKVAEDVAEGEELMRGIAELVEKEKPKKAKEIRKKIKNYVSFLNYPRGVRKHIYTTNPVEGLNRGLELMRLELGGYFPSLECLEANLFVQAVNLADRWQRRPLPTVRALRSELNRLLVLRYELEEV